MNIKVLLMLGGAGFAGAILRYLLVQMMNRQIPGFPWGTLTVNVIGSFAAGAAWVLCRNRFPQYEIYFPILFAGFFGAFTTFSSFALESVRMLANANFLRACGNILLQNLCGLAAAAGGFYLLRWICRS